jgi:hypothetical protein
MDSNYNITSTGYFADKFRFIGVESRKMILSGFYYGADILSLITIASFVYVSKRNVFEKSFKLENFLTKNDIEFDFLNILVADDFINCLFVFNILNEYISTNLKTKEKKEKDGLKNISVPKGLGVGKISKWCEEHFIKFDGLCKVLEIRDTLIENMVENGVNIYYNELGLIPYNINKIIKHSLPEGLIEIKKFKSCIFSGFKLNLLTHDKFTTYKSVYKNMSIKVKSAVVKQLNPDLVEQAYPKFLVSDGISLSQKFGSAQYEFLADGFIGILDNFVDPDLRFYDY